MLFVNTIFGFSENLFSSYNSTVANNSKINQTKHMFDINNNKDLELKTYWRFHFLKLGFAPT